jgi:regulator of protease activity HflC (stomatin/prohibitin superfamily)
MDIKTPLPAAAPVSANAGTDDWTIPESVKNHPYFVELSGKTPTMVSAIEELDRRMRQRGDYHLITTKTAHSVLGMCVNAGEVGLYAYKGRPLLAIRPGNYWNYCNFTHTEQGVQKITDSVDFLGFTSAQVGQSGALVVEDPENRVFVIRNGGFAAYGPHGRFRILARVDTLDLGDGCAIKEDDGRVLGWLRHIRSNNVLVATFLNIPANNVAIVQQGNDLIVLQAGQHVITNPRTTFRRFYTLGERQVKIKTNPAYTVEGVPVVLHVNLRYRLADPIKLTAHYDDPFQALCNPAQTAVNSVVSRLSYQQFMRAKKVGADTTDVKGVPWLESFKSECLLELTAQAQTYGIVVESFDVLDRMLEGALGKDLEEQAEQVLRNQMQATQIELQNHINTETQRGQLEISRVKAEQTKTESDALYYASTRKADAAYYETLKAAEASAASSELHAKQEAKNVITLAEAKKTEIATLSRAYAEVTSDHAKNLQLQELEIQKMRSFPEKTIYFAGGSGALADSVKGGYGLGLGRAMASDGK